VSTIVKSTFQTPAASALAWQPVGGLVSNPVNRLSLKTELSSNPPVLIQRKMTFGQPDDQYEQEADKVADKIMGMPDISVQRLPLSASVSNAASVEATPGVNELLRSPGRPLDAGIRAFMEPRFGYSFGHVRVHDDVQASESARSLNARAYTMSNNIVFGAKQFNPNTTTGLRLLAHELGHVVQQGKNRGLEQTDANCSNDLLRQDQVEQGMIQRQVELSDVGHGEYSGFNRLQELIDRLNAMSPGLTFSEVDNQLTYELKSDSEFSVADNPLPEEESTLNNFDTQMQGFIDNPLNVRLRFTNRHG
jgi:hypothetical protein